MSQLQSTTPSTATLHPRALTGIWHPVCSLEEIWPNMGVCALVKDRQIAVFRLQDDQLYAIDNYDPHSNANVLSRGIVGDLGGEYVVASPIYKHHYQLRSGLCVEDNNVCLQTYAVELRGNAVWVQV